MLTKRQKQVLDYVQDFSNKMGYSPSLEEIKKNLKLSAVSTAHYHIKRLQESGHLQKAYNQPRAITTKNKQETIEVPILGLIAAGQPIEAVEIRENTITLTKDEISKTGNHYALRVQGNSMIDEGIFDGDIVIIREQKFADNGETVVAIIDDNEATLKKLYREHNKFRLQPANPSLLPFYRKEVEVRGVVVKIVRDFHNQIEKESLNDSKYYRRIDYSWDFQGEKTKSYSHGFHSYPAMFIPQVARRLLQNYTKAGDLVCDIFCGSGTALIESRLLGRNSIGIDLNPLAIFLAKTKTTEIDPSQITKNYYKLKDHINSIKETETKKPDFNNIDFWFKESVVIKLAKIKKAINEIHDQKLRNFFLVAFSQTVRLASNTKNGEFKLVRIASEKLEHYNPDVLSIFDKQVMNNISGMTEYYRDVDKTTKINIIFGDSSKHNGIAANSIDCIITSPPYGDSRTTVAYGQFSRLSSQWIDIFDDANDASKVDKELLGGASIKSLKNELESDYLKQAIEKIAKKDEKRAKEVLSFFIGMDECIKQAHKMLKKNKYFCLVIGNRLVKQVRIPTDFIIAELAENIGFVCEDIFIRNIPGKRMPKKNSPTNIAGELEETMNKESIVVLRKV